MNSIWRNIKKVNNINVFSVFPVIINNPVQMIISPIRNKSTLHMDDKVNKVNEVLADSVKGFFK